MPGFFKDRDTVEILFFWAGILLPIITAGAIMYARAQLAEAKRFSDISETIAKHAKANFILNLVDRWNSSEMVEARKLYSRIRSETYEFIMKETAPIRDNEYSKKFRERFGIVIDELRHERTDEYYTVMRIMSFLEMIGLLTKNNYIELGVVDGMFRGPILDIGAALAPHILDRAQQRGVPVGLYENALFLISQVERLNVTQ